MALVFHFVSERIALERALDAALSDAETPF
jgi:hypothetical protein